jgi:hypothetical protein
MVIKLLGQQAFWPNDKQDILGYLNCLKTLSEDPSVISMCNSQMEKEPSILLICAKFIKSYNDHMQQFFAAERQDMQKYCLELLTYKIKQHHKNCFFYPILSQQKR